MDSQCPLLGHVSVHQLRIFAKPGPDLFFTYTQRELTNPILLIALVQSLVLLSIFVQVFHLQ